MLERIGFRTRNSESINFEGDMDLDPESYYGSP